MIPLSADGLRLDVCWGLALQHLRRRLRRKTFWVILLAPLLVFGVAVGLVQLAGDAFDQEKNLGQVHITRVAGPGVDSRILETISGALNDSVARPPGGSSIVSRVYNDSGDGADIEQVTGELLWQVGEQRLGSFLVVTPSPLNNNSRKGDRRLIGAGCIPQVVIVGDPSSVAVARIAERVKATLALLRAAEPDSLSAIAVEHYGIEDAVTVKEPASRRDDGKMSAAMASVAFGMLYCWLIGVSTRPLFGTGNSASGALKNRLEIELTCLSPLELIVAQTWTAMAVGLIFLVAHAVPVLAVLAANGVGRWEAIPFVCAWALLGISLHAPLCILLGLLGAEDNGTNNLQNGYELLLSLLVSAPLIPFVVPGTLGKAFFYFPFTAPVCGGAFAFAGINLGMWRRVPAVALTLGATCLLLGVAASLFRTLVLARGDSFRVKQLLVAIVLRRKPAHK